MKNLQKFEDFYKKVNVIDRKEEVYQILLALLTKEHVLINGKAGTGKSFLANNIFSMFDGSRFSIHMTAFMSEEIIYGPLNIKKFREESVIEYKTDLGAIKRDFLFLDEFFDASDPLLRTLLGLLNERIWQRGDQTEKSPLHTAICTSNYKRENEVTEAVLDRFAFKMDVHPINNTYQKKLYTFKAEKIIPFIKMKELNEAVNYVLSDKIAISPAIIEKVIELRKDFQKISKKYISDRTAQKAIKVLRADAFISKQKTVEEKNLKALKFLFCTLNNSIEEDFFATCLDKLFEKQRATKEINSVLDGLEKYLKSDPLDIKSETAFVKRMEEFNKHLGLLSMINPPNSEIRNRRDLLVAKIKYTLNKNKEKFIVNHLKKDATNKDQDKKNRD
jgi:MoxR-like ATPase